MKKEFSKLTMVEIFVGIWPQISRDRRFEKLLKGRKEKIKNETEKNLRSQKEKNAQTIIDVFWEAVNTIHDEDQREIEVSPHIQIEINKIIENHFE